MRLLLDTHSFIWFLFEAAKLPDATKQLIEDVEAVLRKSDIGILMQRRRCRWFIKTRSTACWWQLRSAKT